MLILALLFVRVLLFIAVGPRSTSAFPNAKCHAPLGAAIDIKACRESFVTRNLYLPARSSLRRRAGDSPRAQSPAGPSTEPGRRPLDAEGLTLGGGRHSPPEDSSEDEDLGPELIASPENQRFSYIQYGTWVQFTRRNNIPRGIWADMEEGWIPLPRPVLGRRFTSLIMFMRGGCIWTRRMRRSCLGWNRTECEGFGSQQVSFSCLGVNKFDFPYQASTVPRSVCSNPGSHNIRLPWINPFPKNK